MVDVNTQFGGFLTNLGAAKNANANALGEPWKLTHMLIGDANGTDPAPSPGQTALVNQVYRAQLNQLYVSPTDDNVLIAELVLPPNVGGWWIRELALEDEDGVFSAVAKCPPSYKPVLAQGSGRNQVVRMHVITSGTANIQLKIDPSVVLATRAYCDGLIAAHNALANPHAQYALRGAVTSIAASTVLTSAQMGLLLADASGAPLTATLPASDALLGVRDIIVRRIDNSGNRLKIQASGTDKIKFHTHLASEGYPFTVLMGAGDWWHLRSDGQGGWWLIGRHDTTPLGRPVFETTTVFAPGGYGALSGSEL
ncbi:phage tail protein, partial [Stutzerimonas stutzeri]|uniref:phage tail protein n=1 Tax=Stutzerimonas stutzeri TaxID=316 RepID=UPI00210CEB36